MYFNVFIESFEDVEFQEHSYRKIYTLRSIKFTSGHSYISEIHMPTTPQSTVLNSLVASLVKDHRLTIGVEGKFAHPTHNQPMVTHFMY